MSRRRSLPFLIAIFPALLVVVGLVAPAYGSVWPRADRIRNWEPEFMARDHTYSRAEAVRHAREFDVIIGDSWAFRAHLGAMRQVNPRLRILAYQNGGYSKPSENYPESWYAHTASGVRIRSLEFGNYLMQISNPNWVGAVVQKCREHLRDSGYDGCFLDSVGPAALDPGYASGLPINPATGQVWTQSAYMNASRILVAKVKNHVGRNLVVANGVTNGREYFTSPGSTGQIVDPIDGGMVELFVRPPYASATSFRSTSDWKLDVDMLVDAGHKGRVLFCVTKSWSSATEATKHKMFRYAMGTFLLGTNGRSYFSFLFDRNTGRSSHVWDAKLGPPRSKYGRAGGVFQRRFRNGRVLVNPSDDRITVRLRRSFITIDGQRVRRVTMSDHSAMILLLP